MLRRQIANAAKNLDLDLKKQPLTRRSEEKDKAKQINKTWNRALGLAHRGHYSKAVNVMEQSSLVPIDDEVKELLKDLHPRQRSEVPQVPTSDKVEVNTGTLLKLIKTKINNGSASTLAGWNGEMVQAISANKPTMKKFAQFIQDIINDELPKEVRTLLLSSKLIAGPKPVGIRPIAIGDIFVKLGSTYVIECIKEELPKIFEPHQLGAGSKNGVERALHTLRVLLENGGPDAILFLCDVRNAHNKVERKVMLKELYRYPQLNALWKLANWKYGNANPLILMMKDGSLETISAEESTSQGCPLAAILFSLAIQPGLIRVNDNTACIPKAIMDNVTLAGEWKGAIAGYEALEANFHMVSLEMKPEKCKVLWIHNREPPQGLKSECDRLGVELVTTGVKLVGAFIGPDKEINSS